LWFVSKISSVRIDAAHSLIGMSTDSMLERVLYLEGIVHVKP